MPEPTPLASLEATALRYAARELTPSDCAEFEARLAEDQAARDALAEAVRLSAAALCQESATPDARIRAAIRDRLRDTGHPLRWVGLGAGVVAAAALFAVQLADQPPPASAVMMISPSSELPPQTDSFPLPEVFVKQDEPLNGEPAESFEDMQKAAEIWAELSTSEHVEKSHEDEIRLQNLFKTLRPATGLDTREP